MTTPAKLVLLGANALAAFSSCEAGAKCLRYAFGFAMVGAPASAVVMALGVVPQLWLAKLNMSHLAHSLTELKNEAPAPFNMHHHVRRPLIRLAVPQIAAGATLAFAIAILPTHVEEKLKAATARLQAQQAPAPAAPASAPAQ